jgi:Tfp pilus assembly protein PilF
MNAVTNRCIVLPGRHKAQIGAADPIIELDGRFSRGGTWTGIDALVDRAYLGLRAARGTEILYRTNDALHLVLHTRRGQLALRNATLTDTSSGGERTRNFPLDRAYRIVHSLVELVIAWQAEVSPTERWTVLVRGFDDAQHLSRRFFEELARRATCIDVVVEWRDDMRPAPPGVPAPDWIAALVRTPLATEIVSATERDRLDVLVSGSGFDAFEAHYPALLAYHRHHGDGEAAARIAVRALSICNHYGFYHEAGSFVDTVLPWFDTIVGDDQEMRWNLVGNIFQGLALIGRQDMAQEIVETLAGMHLTRADLLAKYHYVMAMIHLRYAHRQDIAEAERHLTLSGDMVRAARSLIDPDDYHFFKVFSDNGLAFLRVRQGRREEALRLCADGFALLTAELGENRHQLHRSVLLYNAAQVFVMLDRLDEARSFYAQAAAMDPNYSEYHNELGNILQRQECYDEALAAYDRAIACSAPYPQVHFNKAVCHLHCGQAGAAKAALDYSLELDPAQPEALLLRAEVLEGLGCDDEALADMDAAVVLDAGSVAARVNRAVAFFRRHDLAAALSDMDAVIALDCDDPDHYENRAAIHRAMGQDDRYRRDLMTAVELRRAA